jgi:hypothetical protein
MTSILLSTHAEIRAAQRNLSPEDITYIIQNGSRMHNAGAVFCQLRQKDIAPDTPGNHRHRQLAGTTVVMCSCGRYVITLYREEKAFHRDSRKQKYCLQKRDVCPICAPQPVKPAHTMTMGFAW